MPIFGERSQNNLKTCHDDLIVLFNEVIKHADCSVICGYRDKQAQEEAFKTGKSKARWLQSRHNYLPSMAVDVVPYPVDWGDTKRFYLFAGYVKGVADQLYQIGAMTHKLRVGADWDGDFEIKDQNFHDLPHFELI